MPQPEPMPWIARVFILVFFSVWFGLMYLMLARPRSYIEWFLTRPWKRFGVTVSVTDERMLKRRMLLLVVPLLLGSLGFVVAMLVGGPFSSK